MSAPIVEKLLAEIDDSRYFGHSNTPQDLERLTLQARTPLGFNEHTGSFLDKLVKSSLIPSKVPLCIDLGCGGADVVEQLAVHAEKILAVDNDPKRLLAAANTVEAFGLRGRVKLKEADACALTEIPDETVGMVYQRLVISHQNEAGRKEMAKEIKRILIPGGIVVAEELDLDADVPTWRTFPDLQAHRELHRAFVGRYIESGTEHRMGPKLVPTIEEEDFDVIAVHPYVQKSGHRDPFTRAHLAILNSARKDIIKFGLIPEKEFGELMEDFEKHLATPGTVIWTPAMYQVAARKP